MTKTTRSSNDTVNEPPHPATVVSVIPLQQRPSFRRLDVAPFFLVYLLLVLVDRLWGVQHHAIVTTVWVVTLLTHIGLALSCQWNIPIQAQVTYYVPTHQQQPVQPNSALSSHAWIQTHHGRGIVPFQCCTNNMAVCHFQYQTYRWATADQQWDVLLWQTSPAVTSQQFRTLHFPTQLPWSFYRTYSHTLQTSTLARNTYGSNQTVLNKVAFHKLLGQQLVAPFFVFQLFCVLLWSLDEYWIYAIYTLLALLLFESTVAYQRMVSSERLSETAAHDRDPVLVRQRVGMATQWIRTTAAELVPGDIIFLQHGNVPADCVVLQGWAVCDEALLTGESVPQRKTGIDSDATTLLDLHEHKEHLLFRGTELLVTSPTSEQHNHVIATPNVGGGVVAFVLRTGFDTAQGSLIRTMAYTVETDGVHTLDTFVFIALLLVIAIVAACEVLRQGWFDERRNRFRLLLHVIMIVTSVVPPELPMELSLAVTNSVGALIHKAKVYCSEPFRIPLAGQVNVCCLDKTGTITSDKMRLRGVRVVDTTSGEFDGIDEEDALVLPSTSDEQVVDWPTIRVMAACHALAMSYGSLRRGMYDNAVGDPLELAVLKESGYYLSDNNSMACPNPNENRPRGLQILHRFAFSSNLKRMSVLAMESGQSTVWALTKGAPETVKELLAKESLPANFDAVVLHHMSRGRRVLAMAYRELGPVNKLALYKDDGRDRIERELLFAGFLVLDCPLKADSKAVIKELKKGGQRVVMITGDAILTAAEVSRQVGIIKKSIYTTKKIYQVQLRGTDATKASPDAFQYLECVPLLGDRSDVSTIELSRSALDNLASLSADGEAAFCLTGEVLAKLAATLLHRTVTGSNIPKVTTADEKDMLLHPAVQDVLAELVPMVSVFARHAPHQKEAIIAAMNRRGWYTLHCGDGCNDVGALKRATVGISLISAPEVESIQRETADSMKRRGKKSTKPDGSQRDRLELLREAQEQLDLRVGLGDASVAAPFTSRSVSIKCCKDVIQQGRCTLVTMLSIYKILGINCLVNAIVLSKLFLHGVKQGDRQLTAMGIGVAALFYFVTRAEPLTKLSVVRPPSSVLSREALWSITVQFAIHAVTILAGTEIGLSFVDPYDPSLIPDGPFNPNVLNSCTYVLTCLATINTFAANYRGRPFMADLRENRMLSWSLGVSYVILFVCATEVLLPVNQLLQLTEWPTLSIQGWSFSMVLILLMLTNTLLSFAAARWIRNRFEARLE